MGKKDFKHGMEAGAKPFEEKFKQVSEAVERVGAGLNQKLDDIKGTMNAVIDDLSSIQKKELYDLNTQFDIKEFEQPDKELLIAGLYTLSAMSDNLTDYQQAFIRSVQKYVDVTTPQTSVDLSIAIENVNSLPTQKAIMQAFMEYLFLENENDDFLEDYEELFDFFSVNKKDRQMILYCIHAVYRATGAQGLVEKYGYVPPQDVENEEEPAAKAGVVWKTLTNLPFEPENVKQAASDGKKWIVMVEKPDDSSENILYSSSDFKTWVPVCPPADYATVTYNTESGPYCKIVHSRDKNLYELEALCENLNGDYICHSIEYIRLGYCTLKCENSIWLLFSKGWHSICSFSSDVEKWESVVLPPEANSYDYNLLDILFDGDRWVLLFEKRVEYKYIETGIIFDSTKTSYFDTPCFYYGKSLSGPWEKLEIALPDDNIIISNSKYGRSYSDWNEGEDGSILAALGILIGSFGYDGFYRLIKHKPSQLKVKYLLSDQEDWRTATLPPQCVDYSRIRFIRGAESFACAVGVGDRHYDSDKHWWLLTSRDGIEWKAALEGFCATKGFILEKLLCIFSINVFGSKEDEYKMKMHVLADDKEILEFPLDDGLWEPLAAGGKTVLALFKPSAHAVYLCAGELQF